MKLTIALLSLTLTACNALSGIPPDTVNAIASAGGGCARVVGPWGSGVVMVGSADKGALRNGEVTVGDNCGGISIRNAPK